MTTPSLDHDASDAAYAAAMVLCQGYAPQCSDAGECMREGECFRPKGIGYREARQIIERQLDSAPSQAARAWLTFALSAMEAQRKLELGGGRT